MKKIFLPLIFLISLFNFNHADAKICPWVKSSADYQDCCDTINYSSNKTSCDLYKSNEQNQSNAQVVTGEEILNDICFETKFDSLVSILNAAKCFLRNGVIPIIMGGILLFFLIAILRFISASDSKKQEEYKKTVIWGFVGLFVMISVWGIVEIVSITLGLGSANPVPLLQTKPYNY